MKLPENSRRHSECTPNPVRRGIELFRLNLKHSILGIDSHCVEQFGTLRWEQQKAKPVVREFGKSVLRKPDGVGQPYQDVFRGVHERKWPEDGVAQAAWFSLDNIHQVRATDLRVEVVHDV